MQKWPSPTMVEGEIKVLHVDDEPDFADLAATYLERESDRITVKTATNATDDINQLAGEVDCVISDYEMPRQNGIELLEAIREEHSDLPFILYTGKGSEEIASEAVSAGVTDYLQKGHGPEQYELLANRVINAVEQAQAHEQAEKYHRISTVVRDINKALVEATSRNEISRRVCQTITDAEPYVFAWIGDVDPTTDQVKPQAAAGVNDGYLEDVAVTTDESLTGRGPGGTAVREDRIAVSQNIQADESFKPWRKKALSRGYRAVAGIPLSHNDTQYGLLSLYADRSGAFDEAERELLAELGSTIGHAYHRVEIQQRYEDQYQELFEQAPVMFAFTREVGGEPIIDDCNQLFAETLGYSREKLRGTPLTGVYTDKSAKELLDGGGYDRALAGQFNREQRELTTSDDEVITTIVRATPRRNGEGELTGTNVLFVDITARSEQILSLFEQFPEPVFAYAYESDEPYIRQVNEAFTRTFGYSSEEAIGEHVDSLLVPSDQQPEATRIDDRVKAGDSVDAILQRRTRSGMRDFRFRNIPLSADDVIDGYAIYADITERRQRKKQFRREKQRFQALFEQLTQPVVEAEHDGQGPIVTGVNPAFEETFGYDASTIIGESLDDYIVPDGRQAEAEKINEHLTQGKRLISREVTRKTADGSRDFLLDSAVYEDGSGGFAIYTDITDRKRREEALDALHDTTQEFMSAQTKQAVAEQAVETARTVLDQPINGLWLYNSDSEILQPVAMTTEATDLLGEPPVYTGGESLTWEAFSDNELKVYDDVRTEPGRINAETIVRSEVILPLGEYGVMNLGSTEPGTFSEIDISLVRILGKTVEAALEQATREQQLRSQQATLQRQNERLDNFTGVVSHDLRSPLEVATGRITLAREECESTHLADAADALERMETLIEDLLTIARDGTPVQETETVSLSETAKNCLTYVEAADAMLNAETGHSIQADRSRLNQLVENLVRNAVDHGGDDVTITIGDLADGFYVADDGTGIPPDEHEEVFEAGYSTTENGTGLGLNIVQEIVKAHNWEISVTNSEDGGARFEVTSVDIV